MLIFGYAFSGGKAMKGREFISFFSGVTAAQQMRRVGAFLNSREQDSKSKAYIGAFLKQLEQLGWKIGNNLQLDYRWTGDDAGHIHKHAAELVALAPEVILAADASHVSALQQMTHTIPIVFVQVADPIGAGIVKSFVKPGGNATGLTNCRIRDQCKMFGTAETDCAADQAGGSFARSKRRLGPKLARAACIGAIPWSGGKSVGFGL